MNRFAGLLLTALFLFSTYSAVAQEELRGYSRKDGYQYIELGSFPQTADGEELPILWRILSVSDREAYLLSEYILFNNCVHPDDDAYCAFDGAFNQTEIYSLLNGPFERIVISEEKEAELRRKTYYGRAYAAETSFYEQAFTEAEKRLILDDEQLGHIFLLSSKDVRNEDYGLGTDKARRAYGTEFALAEGLYRYSNGSSPYWTRTQSPQFLYGTRCTKMDGNVGLYPLRGDERGHSPGASAGSRCARVVRQGRHKGKSVYGRTITVRCGVDYDA